MVSLPVSNEAEMLVIGCMLTSVDSLRIVSSRLASSDFYYSEHQTIFNALKTLNDNGKPADIHLVAETLKGTGKLQEVGGAEYLVTLAQYAGTSAYVEEYCSEVAKKSLTRQLFYTFQDLEKKVVSGAEVEETISSGLERLKKLERSSLFDRKLSICFLDSRKENMLLVAPKPKAMLLEYIDNSGSKVGFLPKGIVAMLVGAGGVGKTHLLGQLAIAVATGTAWLNRLQITEDCGNGGRGAVFIGLGENLDDDIHRLLFKASQSLRREVSGENILKDASKRIATLSFCGQNASFLSNKEPSHYFCELKRRLLDSAPREGWSLLILDPISRLMGADAENDNASATQFIALLEELTIDLPGNPTVLCAHHVSKSSLRLSESQDQTASRGASALTDGVRWQASFTRNKQEPVDSTEVLTLKMTKSNFTRIFDAINLSRNWEGFIEIAQSFGRSGQEEVGRIKSSSIAEFMRS